MFVRSAATLTDSSLGAIDVDVAVDAGCCRVEFGVVVVGSLASVSVTPELSASAPMGESTAAVAGAIAERVVVVEASRLARSLASFPPHTEQPLLR